MIEDKIAHICPRPRPSSPPDVGVSWAELPEVLLSGSLHGEKRVGTMVVVEIASLLLGSACCESIPSQPSYYNNIDIMAEAEACRSDMERGGCSRCGAYMVTNIGHDAAYFHRPYRKRTGV